MNRRGFLGAILALSAPPAIVRASSLMPIVVPKLWTPRDPLTDVALLSHADGIEGAVSFSEENIYAFLQLTEELMENSMPSYRSFRNSLRAARTGAVLRETSKH